MAQLKVDHVQVQSATLKEFSKAFPQHGRLVLFEDAVVLINWLSCTKTFKRCQGEKVDSLIQSCGCEVFGLPDQKARERWNCMESALRKLDLWPYGEAKTGLWEPKLISRKTPAKPVGPPARPSPKALAAREKLLQQVEKNAKAVPK